MVQMTSLHSAWMKLPTSDFLWLASRYGVVDEDTMRRICYVVLRDQLPQLRECLSVDIASDLASIIDTANRYDDGHASSTTLVNVINASLPIFGNMTMDILSQDDDWFAMLNKEHPPHEVYKKVVTVIFTSFTFWFGRVVGDMVLDYIAAITRQWAVPNFNE